MEPETLPADVVAKDHGLQRSANQLMELRWHWTLDESNASRVSLREYARQVGAGESTIRHDANAWGDWLASQAAYPTVRKPGAPQTPEDHRQLRKLSADRQEAAQAIAAVTGASVANVAGNKRAEVDAVVNTARERATTRGTTVEHEIHRAAEWREKARQSAKREQDERRKASTLRFVEIEGHLGVAMQRLRKILALSEDVTFTDEESELIVGSLGKMRALLGLIDLRIAGDTDVDWDGELRKLEAQHG